MAEQAFTLKQRDDKAVEKVLMDENIHYIHMIFNKGEGIPEHFTNA